MKKLVFVLITTLTLASACPLLAQDLDKGLATYEPGDYATALKEWKPLAEQGDVNAQAKLGWHHATGKGVAQDYKEAAKWFLLAAEQGHVKAQASLGLMYSKGKGVAQDYKEAAKWYRRAAEQGFPRAQAKLGLMYDKGDGVVQNFALAHMWYNIAAANGNDSGSKYRDIVAAKMTAADISKAQSMARECMNSGYKNCGN
jgi:TPR repeat protein